MKPPAEYLGLHIHALETAQPLLCAQAALAEAQGYSQEIVTVGRAQQEVLEQRGGHLDSYRQNQALQVLQQIAVMYTAKYC